MLSEPDYAALAEFRASIRRFLAFSESAARAAGLEPAQHQLLLALKGLPRGERPTIRAVAERLHIRHHSAVGLVDRLVHRGFLRRRRSEEDARAIHLEITRSGESILRRLSLAHEAELRSAAPTLARSLRKAIGRPPATRSWQGAEKLIRTLRGGSEPGPCGPSSRREQRRERARRGGAQQTR